MEEETSRDLDATREGVPGTRGRTSKKISAMARTNQEHSPSKKLGEAREVPSIRQRQDPVDQLGRKTG